MDYNEFVTDNFKQRHMGILLDNSETINSTYTAVFPSDTVLNQILASGTKDTLLLTYLPMVWDIRAEKAFTDINPELLPELRERRVSIYSVHVPWAKNPKYGPSPTLAKALGANTEKTFARGFGIIGRTSAKTTVQLDEKLSRIVKHRTSLYQYGDKKITGKRVALVSGRGSQTKIVNEIADLGINTYITGVTVVNEYTREAHETAKQKGINIIGATSYSTEKYACIAMCKYFENLGLPSQFEEDEPVLEDL